MSEEKNGESSKTGKSLWKPLLAAPALFFLAPLGILSRFFCSFLAISLDFLPPWPWIPPFQAYEDVLFHKGLIR
ncbi:hypothetical protein [Bacillus salipaludis]|uniref:hypothetical protein n=1 Tax=Bacillus salipaludis TaxID=2547811 RepID=UPI0038734974